MSNSQRVARVEAALAEALTDSVVALQRRNALFQEFREADKEVAALEKTYTSLQTALKALKSLDEADPADAYLESQGEAYMDEAFADYE